MKLLLVKQLNGSFKPAFDSDFEQAKKVKAGNEVWCEIKQPRNVRFHKKFFALINLVFQNQEAYTNAEHLRKDLTIAAGFYDTRFNFEGIEVIEPKSIAFHNMDETEFNEYYNAVVDTICRHFHFDKEEIIENVAQYF